MSYCRLVVFVLVSISGLLGFQNSTTELANYACVPYDTWDTSSTLPVTTQCTIARANHMTVTLFQQKYEEKLPVIFPWEGNLQFRENCEKSNLLRDYGHFPVILSSANSFSYSKRTVTLAKYISSMMQPQNISTHGNETFYHFGDHTEAFETLLKKYKVPNIYSSTVAPSLSWGLAGDGTVGNPFGYFILQFLKIDPIPFKDTSDLLMIRL